jgi:MraZ protein
MFRGITPINLDAKGRLAIPTRYRDEIQDRCDQKMVLTVDHRERCLLLYPLPDWNTVEASVNALPNTSKAARRLQHMLIGHASDLDVDGSGRLLIPVLHREHAHFEKRVVMVGQGHRFEIWSESLWHAKNEAYLAEDDDMSGLEDLRL